MSDTQLGVAATLVGILCVGALSAHGHVAPAVDRNNRYLKLEPMGDRIRFAYTIYWGQIPGAQTRHRLDRNRNGTLEKSEIEPFKREIARSVAASLRIVVDGSPHKFEWTQVHMGLNTPDTSAGAFSIDLVGWICFSNPRTQTDHQIRIYDGYRLARPGENELRVKEAPGITIKRSTIGDLPRSLLRFRWKGGSSKLAKEGYILELKVDPEQADIGVDDYCTKRQVINPARLEQDEPRKPASKAVPVWVVIVAATGAVGIAIAVERVIRRRKPR